MIFRLTFTSLCLALVLSLTAGCGTKKQQQAESSPKVVGEEAIEGTLFAFTQTAEVARNVTETTGSFTEGMIGASSNAVKQIIVSLENLRKKTVETFGQREVTTELVGPAIIECPYCGKLARISDPPNKNAEVKYQCPYCKKEFIIKWVD